MMPIAFSKVVETNGYRENVGMTGFCLKLRARMVPISALTLDQV